MMNTHSIHGFLARGSLSGFTLPTLNEQAQTLLNKGSAASGDAKTTYAEELAAQARSLYKNGHYLEAIPLFQAAYKLTQSAVIEFNIGKCWIELALEAESENLSDAKYAANQALFMFNEAVKDASVAGDNGTKLDGAKWTKHTQEYIAYLNALSAGQNPPTPQGIQTLRGGSPASTALLGLAAVGLLLALRGK